MDITKVEIRTKTIVIFLSLIGAIYLGYLLRNIIIIFIFSYILYSGLKPAVDKLERLNIPRALSIFIIYAAIIFFFIALIFFTIDTLISQIEFFAREFPDFVRSIVESINNRFPDSKEILDSSQIRTDLKDLLNQYTNLSDFASGNIVGTFFNALNTLRIGGFTIVNSVFGGFLSLFAVFMSSAYMLNRRKIFLEGIIDLFPKKYQNTSRSLLYRVQDGLGEWVMGQVILMLSISLLTYIVIFIPYILGIDNYELYRFTFLLAIIAGILEAFPGIGPTITLIIATILALGSGSSLGVTLYIIVSFLTIQQLEGFFITPNVMKRVVNIDPVLSILGIIGGVQLLGVLGAILSIPVIATIQIIILELRNSNGLVEDNNLENKSNFLKKFLKLT